jgi:CheY-like chemotaxis protein
MAGKPHVITVLVVDDEDDIQYLLRLLLECEGMRVVAQAVDGVDALIEIAKLVPPVPTVIVLDNTMPALSGLEVAAHIFEALPDQLIVLFSAFLTPAIVEEARAMGIAACVAKTEVSTLPGIIARLVAEEIDIVLHEPVDLRDEKTDPAKRRF